MADQSMKRVMVMAGGTGGHVFPALAVANELRARGWEVRWLGTPDSFEARVVPRHGFAIDWVHAYRLRGQSLLSRVLAPWRLLKAVLEAAARIRSFKPDLLVGMGGFVTAPGGIAAWLGRRPLVIQEQNTIPGMTNRLLARFARRILQAFPNSFDDRLAQTTGNPVRAEIANLAPPSERWRERSGPCRLLVLGGSLGAAALNERIPETLARFTEELLPEVRHQAGRGKAEATLAAYQAAGIQAEVGEFIDDMAEAYAWADLVICRSGALTVSELAAAGLGAILVPYPHAVDDHQTRNGEFLVQAGAACLIQQAELDAATLGDELAPLLADREHCLTLAQAARKVAEPRATQRIADICEEVVAS